MLWFCHSSQLGGGFEERRLPRTLHWMTRNTTPPSLSSTRLKLQLLCFISSPTPFHAVPTLSIVAAALSTSTHHHLETHPHTVGRWSSRTSCLFVHSVTLRHTSCVAYVVPGAERHRGDSLRTQEYQSSREAAMPSYQNGKSSPERAPH